MWIDIIIVFAYLIGMLLVGFIAKKRGNKSSNNYLLAGRNLGFWMLFACMSALTIGGGTTLGGARLGYVSGFGGIWYPIWQGLGVMVLGLLLSTKVVRLKITSVSELMSLRYGKVSRIYSAAIMTIYEALVAVSQVIAAGTVLSGLTGLDAKPAMLIAGSIGLIYSYVGGMVAITLTDFAQWIIMTIGVFAILLPCSIIKAGGIANIIATVPSSYWDFGSIGFKGEILPKFMLFFLGFLISQDAWQRMMTGKNERISRKSTAWAGFYSLVYGLVVCFVGICALVVFPNISDPQTVFTTMIKNAVPVGLSGIIYAGVLAAIMSTLSGPLLASATLITNDIVMPLSKKERDEKAHMKLTKIIMGSLCIFTMVAALYLQDLLVVIDMAFAVLVGSLFVPIIAAFFWKRGTAKAANYAAWIASAVVLVALFKYGFGSYIPIMIGTAVSAVIFITVSLVTKHTETNLMEVRLKEYDEHGDEAIEIKE